jgi:glutamate 5-kinase
MHTKRVVIKVGSAVLTEDGSIAKERMLNLVTFLSELHKREYEIILVSSGAVAAGYTVLNLDKRVVSNRQALASIGQPLLLKSYDRKFAKFDIQVSQVLLTADDFDSRKRTLFAKSAIDTLLANRVIPIINENDVTATEELVFGDNDQLSAYSTYYFGADMLIILTDIDSYYNKNPKLYSDAKPQKVISTIDESELNQAPSANSEFATGGIVTKLKAANFLLQKDIPTLLTSGFNLEYVRDFMLDDNHTKGTLFTKGE